MLSKKACNIITEGMIGTVNQCIGTAKALNVSYDTFTIGLNQPWRSLSPWLGFENALTFTRPPEPPYPDILLTSGRKAVAASRYIKKQSKNNTFTTHIQDPKISPRHFDLVAVPFHDPLRGDNVVVTDAAPNMITSASLSAAKAEFANLFAPLPGPRVAVLIGGNSRTHKLTAEKTKWLAAELKGMNAGIMVTASRRTGAENAAILKENLTGENIYLWDGSGDNPYHGMLAWADYILVTGDSVSMLSDAGTTGKPVYIIELDGGSKRFDRLYNHLTDLGVLRRFTGGLEDWSYTPLDDAGKIAREIERRMG
jgi:mitochondrial fission protein ELM1